MDMVDGINYKYNEDLRFQNGDFGFTIGGFTISDWGFTIGDLSSIVLHLT
jgi:hypothetical protein